MGNYRLDRIIKFDAIFFDRDGTINEDIFGYINSLEEFKYFSFSLEALKNFSSLTDNFFIVTNQSGLETGVVKLENLELINQKIFSDFKKMKLPLKKIYYANSYKEGFDEMRKPGIGMFNIAKSEFDINLENSLMIGDTYSDMLAGKRVGMKTIFLRTGFGERYLAQVKAENIADLICDNLLTASLEVILK
jgi:D-glycero-D-manno-heptose 1,7-bisphosphate phosphatase